jgi:hypothetical protein
MVHVGVQELGDGDRIMSEVGSGMGAVADCPRTKGRTSVAVMEGRGTATLCGGGHFILSGVASLRVTRRQQLNLEGCARESPKSWVESHS